MTKGRKLSKDSLKIIKALFDFGLMAFSDFIDISYKYKMPWNYRGFFLKLYNLERRGYVVKKEKNNQSFFHLTPKGRLQVLKYLHLEKLKIKKWDRRWRVVIFDIPEDRKKLREYLRHYLLSSGFYPLQESVYLTSYPVSAELDRYLKKYNLRNFCHYLTVSEIDDEEQFKKFFNLK